jgi:hypothetical protein
MTSVDATMESLAWKCCCCCQASRWTQQALCRHQYLCNNGQRDKVQHSSFVGSHENKPFRFTWNSCLDACDEWVYLCVDNISHSAAVAPTECTFQAIPTNRHLYLCALHRRQTDIPFEQTCEYPWCRKHAFAEAELDHTIRLKKLDTHDSILLLWLNPYIPCLYDCFPVLWSWSLSFL